jgi:predicted ATPase
MIRINIQDARSVMIRKLRLRNYKCFEDQLLTFNLLTLLSGLNSTGKSSVIQSLLLLRQSYQQNLLQTTGLVLNGDLVHIGTAKDALFEGAKEDMIGFDLVLGDETIKGTWRFDYDREADVLGLAPGASIVSDFINSPNNIFKASLFGITFHYLQAERIGPRRFFETSDFLVRQRRQLGAAGEYTAQFLAIFGKENIVSSILSHPESPSNALQDQVEAWLGEVSPGTRITLSPNSITDTISLQFSFVTSNQVRSAEYRATNVGFGIIYALPIIVAALSSAPGALLLIENPEAHLHPRGQVRVGELLALAASCGIQVVIETHSDHVLNGIRLAVHGGKLSADDVQLHYFQRNLQNGQSLVTSPHIDRNGRIDQWPDGFFDEWDKSLETLLMPGDM